MRLNLRTGKHYKLRYVTKPRATCVERQMNSKLEYCVKHWLSTIARKQKTGTKTNHKNINLSHLSLTSSSSSKTFNSSSFRLIELPKCK